MGYLLDTLDVAKLNAQRDIVKNERRQSVDNQPYGRAGEILSHAMYPPSHPYSWDVIGSMEDLSAASEDDVKSFFRLYYAPNNAFLSVVGDIDPAQAKAWIAKYFGDIPRGKPITRPSVAPVTLPSEQRLVFEDRVQIPRLYIEWPTVGEKSDDRFALQLLGAILSGPRTARLTKALVYDQQAAAPCPRARDRTKTSASSAHGHAAARPFAHRSRAGRRRDRREDESRRADRRGIAEGHCRRGAAVHQRPAIGSRQGVAARRRRRLPRRPRILPHGVSEIARRHRRRRQARGEPVSDPRARRVERRPDRASWIRRRSPRRARK